MKCKQYIDFVTGVIHSKAPGVELLAGFKDCSVGKESGRNLVGPNANKSQRGSELQLIISVWSCPKPALIIQEHNVGKVMIINTGRKPPYKKNRHLDSKNRENSWVNHIK